MSDGRADQGTNQGHKGDEDDHEDGEAVITEFLCFEPDGIDEDHLHHRPFRPSVYKNERHGLKPSGSSDFFIIKRKSDEMTGEKRKFF